MRDKSSSTVRVVFPPFNRDELVSRLRSNPAAASRELPLVRAALFGSWASGRATVASDIDLLVVYDGPAREDGYRIVRQAIDLRQVELHIYTAEIAEQVRDTLERMTRDAIELWP